MVGKKHIFFDLFGVLLGSDQSAVIHHVSKTINMSYLQTKDILMGEIFMKLERGEIGFEQYFQNIQYALPNGNRLDYNSFKTMWTRSKISELPAVEVLGTLSNKYSLNIISNTSEAHINELKTQFKFFSCFEHIITSEAAKSLKPSIEIFNYALNIADAVSLSSIFIDDMLSNINAANSLGIRSHHYTNYEEFNTFILSLI